MTLAAWPHLDMPDKDYHLHLKCKVLQEIQYVEVAGRAVENAQLKQIIGWRREWDFPALQLKFLALDNQYYRTFSPPPGGVPAVVVETAELQTSRDAVVDLRVLHRPPWVRVVRGRRVLEHPGIQMFERFVCVDTPVPVGVRRGRRQRLAEVVGKETVLKVGVLVRELRGRACGEDDSAVPAQLPCESFTWW